LFKDSSTNKGGVTSSSFEVQAALSLLDQEFMKLMTVQNDKIDEFYKNYVHDICMKVEEKAQLEFEYIWNEH
jgi:glutamate dehydrogenase